MCVCCACCANATNTWSGFASYVVRETQLSSFSRDARYLFYHRLLCQDKMLGFGQWWLTRPAAKASAEATSHRFETTKATSAPSFGFCASSGSLLVLGLIGPAAGQAVLVSDRFTATSSRRDAARHCWTASAPGVAHTLLAGPTSQPAGALNKDAQRPRPRAARQHDADQTKKRPRRQPRLHEPAPRPRPPARPSTRLPE